MNSSLFNPIPITFSMVSYKKLVYAPRPSIKAFLMANRILFAINHQNTKEKRRLKRQKTKKRWLLKNCTNFDLPVIVFFALGFFTLKNQKRDLISHTNLTIH